MRYHIVEQGVVVEVTNSFAQAVAWARVGEYRVYDTQAMRLVYDGATDELIRR